MKRIKNVVTIIILMITIFTFQFGLENYSQAIENNDEVSKITFDKTIGINGFIDDPQEILKVSGTVREYHNYRWITEKANECRFTQGTWWDWDDYYKKLYEAGVDPVPCIQGTSQADRSGYNGNKQQKPINPGEDSLKAESYSEHASTMFQFAARYGSVEVEDSKLLLATGQKRLSGLGYIKYYENWNEPDKTWEGDESHFSGAEYAAMSSADYDGHEGKIGETYGIKNADPNAKLVMGGIAGGRWTVEYLEEMKAWAEENRTDKKIPIDVINFHMYSGKDCPEKYEYRENFEKIVTWRDENAPELEIWMTEFGWDTNTASAHGAKESDQRNFLMRTYLIANAYGIDRSTMYMSRDTGSSSSTGKYATSGLTTEKGKWNKKQSWYGVYTMKNTLSGYIFDSIVLEDDDVYIYKFIKPNSNEECFVLWSPTQDGSKVDNYALNMEGYEGITLTSVVDKSIEGKTDVLEANEGKVTVNVTETPIFVKATKLEEKEEDKPLEFKVKLSLDKETFNPGEIVTAKLSISELIKDENRNGIVAISGVLEYDEDVLELDIESLKGLENWKISSKDFNSDNNKFVMDTSEMVNKPEDVLELSFRLKENAKEGSTVITIKEIEAGTGEMKNGISIANDASVVINIEKPEDELLKGDITLDGKVDIDDLARLKLHCIDIVTLEGNSLLNADLDDDGEVTINDVAILKLMIIGLLTK